MDRIFESRNKTNCGWWKIPRQQRIFPSRVWWRTLASEKLHLYNQESQRVLYAKKLKLKKKIFFNWWLHLSTCQTQTLKRRKIHQMNQEKKSTRIPRYFARFCTVSHNFLDQIRSKIQKFLGKMNPVGSREMLHRDIFQSWNHARWKDVSNDWVSQMGKSQIHSHKNTVSKRSQTTKTKDDLINSWPFPKMFDIRIG